MSNDASLIRVVVVDDSPTARDLLVAIYESAGGLRVVGVGKTGADAVRLVRRLQPDVVSLDAVMPVLNGLEATREIMRTRPTPIVIVTGSLMDTDREVIFAALQAGALAAARKPGLDDPETSAQLVEKVRLMARVPVVRRWSHDRRPTAVPAVSSRVKASRASVGVIGMAASTGGPSALAATLKPLKRDFPVPILVVQHVANGFAAGLAVWLNDQVDLSVKLAGHGDRPQAGEVLLPPDDYHIQVNLSGLVELSKAEPYKGLRPSANYLFYSLARAYGSRAVGVILTGMGDDGADGLQALHTAGGVVLAQEEKSCVVFGMPREAIVRGAVDQVLSPEQIGAALQQLVIQP